MVGPEEDLVQIVNTVAVTNKTQLLQKRAERDTQYSLTLATGTTVPAMTRRRRVGGKQGTTMPSEAIASTTLTTSMPYILSLNNNEQDEDGQQPGLNSIQAPMQIDTHDTINTTSASKRGRRRMGTTPSKSTAVSTRGRPRKSPGRVLASSSRQPLLSPHASSLAVQVEDFLSSLTSAAANAVEAEGNQAEMQEGSESSLGLMPGFDHQTMEALVGAMTDTQGDGTFLHGEHPLINGDEQLASISMRGTPARGRGRPRGATGIKNKGVTGVIKKLSDQGIAKDHNLDLDEENEDEEIPASPSTTVETSIKRPRGRPPSIIKQTPRKRQPVTPTLITNTPDRPLFTQATSTPCSSGGLRSFSSKVCDTVERKGITTYTEVADELVMELASGSLPSEQKNIRRRVYDALNVLMAIDVIRKDKKEIRWVGFPEDLAQPSSARLQSEQLALTRRVTDKQRALNDLLQRFVCLKALVARNARLDGPHRISSKTSAVGISSTNTSSVSRDESSASGGNSAGGVAGLLVSPPTDRLYLPFVLVNASKDCRVHCEMLEDRTQYFFDFDSPFMINDDIEVLRLMGLDMATPTDLTKWLPRDMQSLYQGSASGHHAHVPNNSDPLPSPPERLLMSEMMFDAAGVNTTASVNATDIGPYFSYHQQAIAQGSNQSGLMSMQQKLRLAQSSPGRHHNQNNYTNIAGVSNQSFCGRSFLNGSQNALPSSSSSVRRSLFAKKKGGVTTNNYLNDEDKENYAPTNSNSNLMTEPLFHNQHQQLRHF